MIESRTTTNKHAVNKNVKRKIFNMRVFMVEREAFFLLFLF